MRYLILLIVSILVTARATAAIQVNIAPTTLVTNEDGSNVTYEVVLDEAPSAGETVTVTPSSGDVTEGTVSGALIFTDANWDVAQTVTVTPGASGDGNDGDVAYTITNTTTAAGGTASFNGAPTPDVNATNRNIEGVSTILMNPASGSAFYLVEGTSQTVTISVAGAPANDVSIDVSIAGAEATVSTATVTLTAGNGYSASFDVTAVDDALIDGDQAFTVVTAASVSVDVNFSGINLSDIDGLAIDNDVAPPAPPVTAVPTLPTSALLLLMGLIVALGARRGFGGR